MDALEERLKELETRNEALQRQLFKQQEQLESYERKSKMHAGLEGIVKAFRTSNRHDAVEPYQNVIDFIYGTYKSLSRAAILVPSQDFREEDNADEFRHEGRQVLRFLAQRGYPASAKHEAIPLDAGISGQAFLEEISVRASDTDNHQPFYNIPGDEFSGSELAVPIINKEKHGVLALSSYQKGAFDNEVSSVVQRFAEWIALEKECIDQDTIDHLTGLYGRKRFDNDYHKLFDELRGERDLGLVLIDVNALKVINDRHGHYRGDAYLTMIAETIHSTIRGSDSAYRLGGDEFTVLLPGVNGNEGIYDPESDGVRNYVVNRLSPALKEATKEFSKNTNIELPIWPASIGWESMNHFLNENPAHILTRETFFDAAETWMYNQKDQFREAHPAYARK